MQLASYNLQSSDGTQAASLPECMAKTIRFTSYGVFAYVQACIIRRKPTKILKLNRTLFVKILVGIFKQYEEFKNPLKKSTRI